MKDLLRLRGEIPKRNMFLLSAIGITVFLVVWHLITVIFKIHPGIFPSPIKILAAFPELHFQDALLRNALYSLKLNILGIVIAFASAFPLGFVVGLWPLTRGFLENQISIFRYAPLTILAGVFIDWFGLHDLMKVSFLAFGIFVYLFPTVIQRLYEVDVVYQQTAQTCGASNWQIIKTVLIPGVLSKVIDDVRILAPISWTYIIIAEMLNRTGGLGALAYISGRSSRADKAFAVLYTIMIIATIMDWMWSSLDKMLFPFKYASKEE